MTLTMIVVLCTAAVVLSLALYVTVKLLSLRQKTVEPEPERYPFTQSSPMSEAEQVFYWRLRKVLPDQIVLAQVALSRIVKVEPGNESRRWLGRVNRLTVDFVVCLPDASIVAVIELDDGSHESVDRVAAEAKKTNALASAGIQLLRYGAVPSEEELRKVFLE